MSYISPEEIHDGLLAVMERYLSTLSAQSSLKKAFERMGIDPSDLTPENLPEIVSEAMVGIRIFCPPEKIGDFMVDLAELCEEVGSAKLPDE